MIEIEKTAAKNYIEESDEWELKSVEIKEGEIEHPVVLIHGFWDTPRRHTWETHKENLREHDSDVEIHQIDFSRGNKKSVLAEKLGLYIESLGSIKEYAEELKGQIEDLDVEEVNIIAHSMGGLVARWYIEELGGAERVKNIITLGTPHRGTMAAYLAYPTRAGRGMVPGSPIIEKLNEDGLAEGVDYTAVWSEKDQFMVPRNTAMLPYSSAHNIKVQSGHRDYLTDDRIVNRYIESSSLSEGLSTQKKYMHESDTQRAIKRPLENCYKIRQNTESDTKSSMTKVITERPWATAVIAAGLVFGAIKTFKSKEQFQSN